MKQTRKGRAVKDRKSRIVCRNTRLSIYIYIYIIRFIYYFARPFHLFCIFAPLCIHTKGNHDLDYASSPFFSVLFSVVCLSLITLSSLWTGCAVHDVIPFLSLPACFVSSLSLSRSLYNLHPSALRRQVSRQNINRACAHARKRKKGGVTHKRQRLSTCARA